MPIKLYKSELLVSPGVPPSNAHDLAAAAAGLANGGFALTYAGYTPNSVNFSYFVRVYDGFGNSVAGPTGIGAAYATYSNGGIAELANGRLVETFAEVGPGGGDPRDIAITRFPPDLSAFSPIVNPGPNAPNLQPGAQSNPSLASGKKGGYMVVWDDDAATYGRQGLNVIAQVFKNGGNAVGPAFVASESPATSVGDQASPDVASLKNGAYVVAWQDDSGLDGDAAGIRARKFSADGDPASGEMTVNQSTGGPQVAPAVAGLKGGGFVVAWQNGVGSLSQVAARVFKANGAPVTGDIEIPASALGSKTAPDVTALLDGGFVVVWTINSPPTTVGGDGSGRAIKARAFDKNGAPTSDEILVNSTTVATQRDAMAATLADGRVIVTWSDQSDSLGGGHEARAQILDPRTKGVKVTGTEGPDKYVGTPFRDVFEGEKGNDRLKGFKGNDLLKGKYGRDNLEGGNGSDRLEGGKGPDKIFGGGGKDTSLGGPGKDMFIFAKKLEGGAKADRLPDFSPKDDTLVLDNAIFKKLKEGKLAAKHFKNAKEAKDGNDYVYHNPNNGGVYYDRNGDKSGGVTKFAVVDAGLKLSADDILVI